MCNNERNASISDNCYLKASEDKFHWQCVNMMHKTDKHEKNLTNNNECTFYLRVLEKAPMKCSVLPWIWTNNLSHDIRLCSALITDNDQMQEINNFVFGWNCKYKKGAFIGE